MAQQNVKRNPYLADYASYNSGSAARCRRACWEQTPRRPGSRAYGMRQPAYQAQRARGHVNRRKRQRARRLIILATALMFGMFLWGLISLTMRLFAAPKGDAGEEPASVQKQEGILAPDIQGIPARAYAAHPTWTEDFLTVNEYSRPGDALDEVSNIFVHYTANQGTSAAQNRNYFEQLKDSHERSASAHFIIGYNGEIIQCIPLDEIAYAVQTRNQDSISVECCYLAENGAFTQETYDSLVALLAWLTETYGLESGDILRHYDCGGKKCPIYYVEDESAWEQLKKDVISVRNTSL